MTRRYSLVEARAALPSILDAVEAGSDIELTRHGKSIAVVMSLHQYERLRGERSHFSEAYQAFLARHRLSEVGLTKVEAGRLRDRSAGRKVTL